MTSENQQQDRPEPPLPGLAKQAANFAKAVAQDVAAGSPRADARLWISRVSACRTCPLYRPSDKRCSECGCYVDEKAKWLLQVCPHPDGSRWPNLLEQVQENKS